MSKLLKLLTNLENKKKEVRGFLDENKIAEAEKAMEEKRSIEKEIEIEKELEEDEKRDLESQRNNSKKTEKTSELRAITKRILGEELTDEERAIIQIDPDEKRATVTSAVNAAVLPKEFVNKLQEIQKGYAPLKALCDVTPVTKNEGTMPFVDLDQNDLPDVLEGDDITDGTLVTTDIAFKCVKSGLITTLTSELVDDAEVEIEGLVNKNFANISVIKQNKKILNALKAGITATTATSYEDIERAIDETVPAAKLGMVTIVNTKSYAYLKNLKDKEGRNLNLITTNSQGIEIFNSKPIIEVDDVLLPPAKAGNIIAVVANFAEAVKYFDRKQITIARSTEAGFKDDTIKIRILERYDVKQGSKRSIKVIEFTAP